MNFLPKHMTPQEREQLLRLVKSRKPQGTHQLSPIGVVSREGGVELSFAQQRLWFLAQMEGISQAYHIPFGLRLYGSLDREALKQSLDRIVFRHEALRTCFQRLGGQPRQLFAPAACGVPWQEHDLSAAADPEAALRQHCTQEVQRPFDLQQAPLIRGHLLRLAPEDHVLLLTLHHIVSDGWSMGILTRELSALYRAFHIHRPDPLPPLSIQYPDYAAWQRQRLNGELLQRETDYWQRTLQGAPSVLALPTDRPRPAQQNYVGDAVPVHFTPSLTLSLKALAQRCGMTLYMLLLAAWAVVLARLSGQQEVVIGTGIANRTRPELEALIGFFVNTQALRIDLSASVEQLLAQVKTLALQAQQHQDLPFEQVVDLLKPARNLAYTPIFQVMLTWQNQEEGRLDIPELAVRSLPIAYPVAKFDLELDLGEVGDGIAGCLRYATALFDHATIQRHVGYLQQVLTAFPSTLHLPVPLLPILPQEERQQLLDTWNETRTFAADRCIHQLFEEQVARTPDKVAVTCQGQSITYRELNRQANCLAQYLQKLGVKPDDRVALCAERSLEMVVGILAVLKAGGAYLPLDPAYPVERLEYMLEDSAPVALLVHLSSPARALLSSILAAGPIPVIDLRRANQVWFNQPETNLPPTVLGLMPRHLAYVIYTSGSTGKPKGVMVEHSNVVRLFTATEEWFHFNQNDVWTLFHSYAFDFSVWELWGALIYGGRLVIVPHATAISPRDFYSLLCEEHVTVLNQTPSAFRQLIAAQEENGGKHCLRYVVFGGEALPVASLRPCYRR
jgi:non-ribosomal peptide synthetase component F